MAEPEYRYKPGTIASPPTSAQLSQEFRRVSHATLVRPTPLGILQGMPPAVAVGITPAVIVNWPAEYEAPFWEGFVSPVAGSITIPETGGYSLRAFASGSLSGPSNNQQIGMQVNVNGAPILIAAYDTSNQTAARAFNGGWATTFTAGDVLTVSLVATAAMGTFTFAAASFEVLAVDPE